MPKFGNAPSFNLPNNFNFQNGYTRKSAVIPPMVIPFGDLNVDSTGFNLTPMVIPFGTLNTTYAGLG